jgi:hypothetical protein
VHCAAPIILGLYSRPGIKASSRVSNPGNCSLPRFFLTSTFMLTVSSYSNAGTIAGQNDPDGRPTAVPKPLPTACITNTKILVNRPHPRTRSVSAPPISPHSLFPTSPSPNASVSKLDVKTGPAAEDAVVKGGNPLRIAFVPVVVRDDGRSSWQV